MSEGWKYFSLGVKLRTNSFLPVFSIMKLNSRFCSFVKRLSLKPETIVLKILATIFFVTVIINELIIALYTKPTHLSIKQTEIDRLSFPRISLCFLFGWETNILFKNGYGHSYDYFTGKVKDRGELINHEIILLNIVEYFNNWKMIHRFFY